MKIKWSKDSAENDRVVCEAVGIEPLNKRWMVTNGNGFHILGFKNDASADVWIKRETRNPGEFTVKPDHSFPKVTTDANEALKVSLHLDKSHGHFLQMSNFHYEPGWSAVLIFPEEDIHEGPVVPFCEAICLAALRAKGIEVEL